MYIHIYIGCFQFVIYVGILIYQVLIFIHIIHLEFIIHPLYLHHRVLFVKQHTYSIMFNVYLLCHFKTSSLALGVLLRAAYPLCFLQPIWMVSGSQDQQDFYKYPSACQNLPQKSSTPWCSARYLLN